MVMKVKEIGDNSRLLWILTEDRGLIRAFDRGQTRKNFAATEQFCLSDFLLFRGRDSFKVNLAEVNEVFFDLRTDIITFSLASYFCEVICNIMAQSGDSNQLLELLTCSLHLVAKKSKDVLLVKSVFELKIACLLGFFPNLTGGTRYFSLQDGCLLQENKNCISLSDDVLAAMSFIINLPIRRSFSFQLSSKNLCLLNNITEKYLINRLESNIKSLPFLKRFLSTKT